MSKNITKIRTDAGDLQIDYNALANLPGNPNLLINSDFRSPINQRGQTSYSGFGIYTIDRWQTKNVTVSVVDGGITLKNSGTSAAWFFQPIEKGLSGTYTASANVSAVSGSVKFYCQGFSAVALQTGVNKFTVTTSSSAIGQIAFELAASASVTIKWVKLENGSVATNFVTRSYGEEVVLCERFFQKVNLYWRPGVVNSAGNVVSFVADVQLRNLSDQTPLVTLHQVPTRLRTTESNEVITTLSLDSVYLMDGMVALNMATSTTLTARSTAWAFDVFKVYVDAEIY